MRPLLLDLFCGAGGAAVGYHRAGFDVVGVDTRPQPRYPFAFVQADAMTFPLDGYDAIHASPPCQRYSILLRGRMERDNHADLVAPVRERLRSAGVPYVIENVVGAPLLAPYLICGGALGLGTATRHLRRHRLFESSVALLVPACSHPWRQAVGVYGHGRWDNDTSAHRGGYQADKAEAAEAMGIDWMTRDELVQAIPPAYTELVGWQLLAQLPAA